MKIKVPLEKFYVYGNPRMIALVSCVGNDGKANIITLAMHAPMSINPPKYGIGIDKRRFSYSLIEETGEFTVNFCPFAHVEKLHFCGRNTGRGRDKFKEAGFTPIPSETVKPPLIKECYAHYECKVSSKFDAGSHFWFIGDILNASIDKEAFDDEKGVLAERWKPTYYLGNNTYTTLAYNRRSFDRKVIFAVYPGGRRSE